ncbi:amino acid adenylation domain-containing protein [Bradyrhizobium japonicum]|nr:amino acid adenylation domain-containing protein [Bradyrhizobium japonicum]
MADTAKPSLRDLDPAQMRKLIALARDRGRNADRSGATAIAVVARDGSLEMSFAQQRLWLLAQLDGANSRYHIRGALRLSGELDVEALRRSIDRLFARHEALRSVFRMVDEQPRVVLLPADERVPLLEQDLRGRDDREQELARLCREEAATPFDLATGPLIRGRLIRTAEREYLFLLTQHHIVSDGWSIGVLTRELGALYQAFAAGKDDSLPPLAIQYPDYAAWQRQWLSGERLQRQVDYWRQALADAPAVLELPTDRPRAPVRSLAGASLPIKIDAELASGIRRLSQSHRASVFMTVLAAWAAVLSRLSGQTDIVIGTPTANRNRPEIEGLIGFFVNMLAVRVDLSAEPSVAELLRRVRAAALAAQDHQDLPFERVVEIMQPLRGQEHTPLFQVVFAWQSNEAGTLELPGLKAEAADIPLQQVRFDLELGLGEMDGRIVGSLNYATALFDEATIRRHRDYLLSLLRAMVADPEQVVDRIGIVGAEERRRVLDTWNETTTPFPSESCIHELFAEQVRKAPDAIALVFEDVRLSYGELDAKASRLARRLTTLGLVPDQPVAICLPRGLAMVVSLLAVLKAGGAYLPLDPAYPAERLRQIVDDAKPKVLIADGAGSAIFPRVTCEIVDPDADASVVVGQATSDPTDCVKGLTSRSLAYIIYTSGSTGRPKGVMVEHRGLVNLALAQRALFEVSSHSRVVQFASFSFDASIWEIVMALCSGAALFLAGSREHQDTSELLGYLADNAITHATLPPAMLHGRTDLDRLASLRVLVLAGELPKAELIKGVPAGVAVFNGYGPTEATVCATSWVRPPDFEGDAAPIGRPLPNVRIYLLDRFGAPVPLGAVGEIYIGGVGVARGYLNRADLTAERFVRDPFHGDAAARMYRTGDLGRYLPDGNIAFLGRNDHQVKIRGFRIELGEIEFRINEHADVTDSVVLMHRDHGGDTRLVAYVAARRGDGAGGDAGEFAGAMRDHLRACLPDYMVPSAFVRLDALPLTPNGKVDRKALPEPEDDAYARGRFEPPQGDVEQIVAKVWAELLGVDQIGRSDHFFELGGHSLLAVRMLERLQRYALRTDARTLFAKPVLADFAASLDGGSEVDVPVNGIARQTTAITPELLPLIALTQSDIDSIVAGVPGGVANIQDIYGLSPLQDGILFHHLLSKEGDPYLLVGRMAFASRDLLDRYLDAVRQVVDRHDILRTSIVWNGLSTPAQVVWRQAPLVVSEVVLDGDGPADEQLARRFDPRCHRIDLGQPPLLQFAVAADPKGERWLLLVLLHHLIGDHSTLEVMNDEVGKILSGLGQELPPPYPFRKLVAQSRASAATADHERFFRAMLADIDEPTTPFGLDRVHGDGGGIVEARRTLPEGLNARLRAQARRLGVSLASLCHLAWGQVVARTSGRERVVFGTVLFGRMQAGAGGDRTMGLFINTLPLRFDLDDTAVEDSVRDAHRRLTELMAHEHASLALAQRCSGVAAPAPLFSAILNYRHNAMPADLASDRDGSGIEWLGGEERTNYPLMLAVEDYGQALGLTAQIVRPLSADHICALMQQALDQLAEMLEHAPRVPVRQLDILPPEERQLLLEAWNRTQAHYLQDQSFVAQFEAQVRKSPEAIALVFGETELSYAALNARANRLARRLRDRGVGTEIVVGLALERGVGMLVALLAVLKAGGAYLPLDPDYPPERLAHMLRDSGAALVLTQTALRDQFSAALEETGAEVWLLDGEDGEGGDAGNLDVAVHGESLAYVIYTSGSTGLPKGVMVRHDAVTNFRATMAEQPGMTAADRVLGLTSLSFDIAVLELWLPLTIGARVVLADRAAAHDPLRLKAIVERHGVSLIQATPSTWRMLLDHEGPSLPASCRVLCGGEALPPDLARRLVAQAGEVWNLYGPTETTVWSARHRLDAMDDRPLLGGPIGNTTLHILGRDLNLAPVGVAGELYIGGSGLARGYWRRGALTAERFIPDPFGPPGARLYRTGDVARWRSDGVLDYVGRADHQVKIRGFRIELGEIEARLLAQDGVRTAVVVAHEAGAGRQLVGYVSGEALDGVVLRVALSSVLPDYMVPARIVVLERLPLTPNGKVDRKALPAPDQLTASAEHVAPRTPAEAALAAIWADLLRQPNIGVTDNFFELGGDSIISLQMVSRARRQGVLIEPRDVFRHQTIEALAASSRDIDSGKGGPASERGSLAGLSSEQLERLGLDWSRIEDVYPLSPMQQGMLFHSLRDAGSGVYVNQVSVEIRGLDPERLGRAWREVSARHQIMRTGFLWRELSGSPLQVVYRDAVVPFAQDDWRGQTTDDERIAVALADERTAEFDLQAPPLQRVRLLRLQDDFCRLIWTYHHILMDGWSSARFVGEVLECYYGGTLAANATRYRDYIAWLMAQDARAAEAFWREQLGRFDQPTQLADAFGAHRHQASGHERCYTRLGETATAELKAFARRERITLNTIVQGVWALLLQRYTGQNTVTFGVTVAGRPAGLDGSQQMLGLFINTLPVIETLSPASTIGEWLRALQDRNSAMRDYEHTPLYDIQGWAGRAGQTMFDSIIVFENYPIERSMHRGAGALQFSGLKNVDVTNYPMDLSVLVEDTLQVEYTYMPSHFTAAQAAQIKVQFEHLLTALTRDATALLGSIDPVTELDAALADRCNRNATPSVPLPPVHEAIASHARRHPERTALTIGSTVLSFGDLERRANRLAHHLISRGLKPEQRVGVVVGRTAVTMIALLAVLKAGGAYVPLDPELPSERRAFVMRDAAIAFLLTGRLEIDGSPDGVETISLSTFDFDEGADHPPQPELHPENLAYLIYTSGSTGVPKGVAVAHGPLAMHCHVTGSLYEIDESSCELHFLSLAFDGAHERWLTVLSHGARLLMRDAELWTPEQTVENLHAHGVSHIGLPPAYLQQVAECVEQNGNPPPVKLYSFGGEAMPKAGFDKVRRVLKPRILINGYGPTETVVTPLVWKVDGASECDTPYAPIGVPVGDRRAYILDAALDIIPAGVAGELYLGGFGLARGYHGKAGMTAERFVPDPFSSVPGARLYRTGDLARWREDGTVEYLGRSDDQVKVNGFRIELGEIQTSLLRHEAVAQAAVVAMPSAAGNQLIAYVAPKAAADAAPVSAEALVERLTGFLKRILPAYMVPARIVMLERLPTLSSGKIDRRALPAPDASMRSFVAPQGSAEIALARLWSDILKVPQVGVTDNFFELGGNSILCLRVVARVRQDKTFGIEIKLRDLLQKPTIRALLAGSATTASAVAPSALLPLNAAVRGVNPVFCVHGGFGTVFDYGPLARRLEGRRQVIGLQSRMLVDPAWTDASLEAMAVDYAAEIRRMQPRGPYSLVGWSLGGFLVSLVAAELERAGERVDRLVMVDSFVPRQPDGSGRQEAIAYWADDLAGLLSAVLPSATASRIKAQVDAAKRADLPETPQSIRDLVASVVEQGRSVSADDASLGADDLSAAFAVGRHLNRLAQHTALPRGLEAAPLCWWTSVRLAQRDRLETQLPKAVDRGLVGDNHFRILKDAGLLNEICGLLMPEAASMIAQDTVPEPAE